MTYRHRHYNRTLGSFTPDALLQKIAREAHLSTPLFLYRDADGREHMRAAYYVKNTNGDFAFYRVGDLDMQGRLTGQSLLQRLFRSSSEEAMRRMMREHEKSYARATHVSGTHHPIVSRRVHNPGDDSKAPTTVFELVDRPGKSPIRVTTLPVHKKKPVAKHLH